MDEWAEWLRHRRFGGDDDLRERFLAELVERGEHVSWEVFLNISGNPKIPTFAEAMEEALTPSEQARLTEHLRPLVENGRGEWRLALAHLVGAKSGAGRRPVE